MSLDQTFCASPWLHMRITNSGTYEACRWQVNHGTRVNFDHSIQQISPLTFFQKNMAPLRSALLDGQNLDMCGACYKMEQHGKVSGRQRQLLKVGIQTQWFDKSLASSTLRDDFDYSNSANGTTTRTVVDWQIDLGNYCNSACVFCGPENSSRMAAEFKHLGLIDSLPPTSWCDDPALVDRFISDLVNSKDLHYLHFIGGETLITPGFRNILSALITADIASQVTVGFTTNLTVWDQSIIDLLTQFKQVNLGMSVETLTKVNDYIRYPSKLSTTQELLDRWVSVARQQDWLIQLRVTPTCLTVHELSTVYDYAWQHGIAVESCNFLYDPSFMRIGVLPAEQRQQAHDKLSDWVKSHQVDHHAQIVNTRDPNMSHAQIYQDALSYLDFLNTAQDESNRLPDLIDYLKRLESGRKNSVLDYLPQYESLFRSHGY